MIRRPVAIYGSALAALLAAVLLRWLLDPFMGDTLPLVTIFGAVAFAVWIGGTRPAALVVVLGYFACAYLFIQPRGSLALDQTANLIGLLTYLITCSIIIAFGRSLRRSEKELSDFFENATVGMHWVGPDGTILRANQTELDLLGYTRDEYVGHHIAEFHADAPVIKDILACLTRGQEVHDYPARLRCKDGSLRDVVINSNVLFENGKFIHTRCFTRDVSALKDTEEQLRRSAELLTFLIDRSPTGFYIVDSDFRISHVNADSQTRAFRNVSPAIGRRFDEAMRIIWPEPLATEIIGIFRHTLETGEPYRSPGLVSERNDLNTVETYEWQLDRLSLPDGTYGVVCYYYDTTALREAERQLRENDRRKDEFLATLAHELRNPLAPIRNGLEIMRLSGADRSAVERALPMMERQLGQMIHLVDDLLDVSRISRGLLELRKERVALRVVLNHAIETSRPVIEANRHELVVNLPPDPVLMDADVTRLAQVFANLLNNAAKYSNPGCRIELSVIREHDETVVRVKDAGIGIPPEMLPRVFEMFTQVDRSMERSQGGLGIGLTLVKRLVEMHGGSVEARSDGPGKGSEFLVRLPVDAAVREAPTPTSSTAGARHG